jgi:RNA polymerase-associated protein RTF1
MADLDAELLALAGDSSDDEGAQNLATKVTSRQPSSSPSNDGATIATAPKKSRKPAARRKRDDSEEEGEA